MTLRVGNTTIQPDTPAQPEADATPDHIRIFLFTLARNLAVRRDLATAVRRLRTLDRKLADPALADHPDRANAVRRRERREQEEYQLTTRLIECNVQLERCWEAIGAAEKHRYGLTYLVGEPDPEMPILGTLWRDDVGLAQLVPFPDDWSTSHELSHRAFDTTTAPRIYTIQEVMNHESAPF